ncbi:MAG: 23S rRNA (pseudouridine(1915)-N(3))-methyltransferase RlmH [Nanobdellota archaeon]
MKFKLICFGKVKDKHVKSLIDEYERRLVHHNIRYSVIEWSDSDLKKQQERIKSYVNTHPEKTFFLLDEYGMTLTTTGFADKLENEKKSDRDVVFILGDAHGFDESFKKDFSGRLSLSPMTFPHELARLLLTEQVYRVVTLWNRIPYHK